MPPPERERSKSKMKCDRVIINIRRGVAEIEFRPENVTVEIRDYDSDGCDPNYLDEDGAVVSIYEG